MADRDHTARDHRAEANRLIAYHSPIAQALSAERTSLESKLIPVTAYVITACVECWYRYPEMIRAIDAAMPAEEIGRIGRRPGTRINTVHLWGVPNFWLLGRKVVAGMGFDANDPDRAFEVLDFWERAASRVPQATATCRRGTPTTCARTTGQLRRSSSRAPSRSTTSSAHSSRSSTRPSSGTSS